MIHVYSRQLFDKIVFNRNYTDDNISSEDMFFICIMNTNGFNSQPHFKQNHVNVLNLWFDDCDVDKSGVLLNGETYTERAMTPEQAKQIYDFLLVQKQANRTMGIVHCAAGIARSGAVGTFAADFLDFNRKEFITINNAIRPNGHILQLLNRILWEEHLSNLEM